MSIYPVSLRPNPAADAEALATAAQETADDAVSDLATHEGDTGNPHSVTAAQAGALPTPGGTATAGYYPAATGTGQASTWTALVVGDAAAIHDDVSGEIAAVAEKTTPVAADLLLIEDSAASNSKKRLQIGNLPRALPGPCIFSWAGDDTGAHRSTTSSVTIGNIPWRPSTYDAVWTHVRFVMLLSATAAGAEPVNVNLIRTQLFGGSEGAGTELAISSTSSIAGGTSAWSIVTALVARSSLSASDRHYSIQLARGGATGSVLGLSFSAFLTTSAG